MFSRLNRSQFGLGRRITHLATATQRGTLVRKAVALAIVPTAAVTVAATGVHADAQDSFATRRARSAELMLGPVWTIRTNSRHTHYAFRNEHRLLINELNYWDKVSVWGTIATGAGTTFATVLTSAFGWPVTVPILVGAMGTLCTGAAHAQRASWQTKADETLAKAANWSAVHMQADNLHTELKSDFIAASTPLSVMAERYNELAANKAALDKQNHTTNTACYQKACDELRDWDEGNPAKGIMSEPEKIRAWIEEAKKRSSAV